MEVSRQIQDSSALSCWYPLGKRLYEPQSRSGRRGEEKNPCLCRDSNSEYFIIQSVSYPDPQQSPSTLRTSVRHTLCRQPYGRKIM
jgi:hypothetical protein